MKQYDQYVTKHRKLILDAEDYIWANPETGYKEWKTHKYMEDGFRALGYELTLAGNIPGFIADIDTGRPGPTVAVFGELDSLICRTHPDADPETGAVHACGHSAQSAALLGLAAALKEPGVLDDMCGKIRLISVPAEELIEVEYREELRRKGIIRYFGGKPEFMYRGLLDGVDMALMVHTSACGDEGGMTGGSNGCLAKSITFQGVASHAGGSPHNGINALYAANLALNACNALRETFQDDHHIRFHPIITHGGEAVNAIPETVRMESYVRGASMEEIVKANRRINRAIAASAAAMGAKVHLRDIPGYWPRIYPKSSFDVVRAAGEKVFEKVLVNPHRWGNASSDMGDVAAVMPAFHPYAGGAVGKGHGNDYYITQPEIACVKSASFQLYMLAELLENGAEKAKAIIAEYEPPFKTMKEYFDYVDSLNLDQEAVIHEENGKISLQF